MPPTHLHLGFWIATFASASAGVCAAACLATAPPPIDREQVVEPVGTLIIVEDKLGAKLDEAVRKYGLGQFWGAVLVVKDGEIVLGRGYGFANESLVEIAPDSLFDIGSVAKQFTAAAILKLETMGKLKTGDPIARHLPDVPNDKAGVTIYDLLTHTSGIPTHLNFARVNLANRDQVVKHIMAAPLQSKPGNRFEYNNVGYFLLAAIVERASGKSFEQFLRERIFAPAGMKNTGFVDGVGLDASKQTARVTGESNDQRGGTFGYSWNWANRGATGVVTTILDLMAWDQALHTDAVLSADARLKFFTPYKSGYACGWFVSATERGTTQLHHGGSTRGYRAHMTRLPDERTVIAILSNTQHDVAALERRLQAVLFPKSAAAMQCTLNLKPYQPNEHGVIEIPQRARWIVLPRFTSGGPEGPHTVDERPTLILEDSAHRQWTAIVRMDQGIAKGLATELGNMLGPPDESAGGAEDGAPDGEADAEAPAAPRAENGAMDVAIAAQPYTADQAGAVTLPEGVRWRVLPQYVGLDDRGNRQVDDRPTLILLDEANRHWPLIVKMDRSAARRLLGELNAVCAGK